MSANEEQCLVGEHDTTSRPSRNVFTLVGVVISAALLLSVGLARSKPEGSGSIARLGYTPRACTFEECYPMRCNAYVNPYICLEKNGGWHGGCSPTPWLDYTCDVQCNLKVCDSYEIPTDLSCKGIDCGAEWCGYGGKFCGSAAPYQCVDGSGRYGCSGDEHHWLVGTIACNKCCDTNTCRK